MSDSQQQRNTYTEQELIRLLRDLPQPISIMQSEQTGRYIWTWLGSRGTGETFLEALENVLTHIEVSYTESNEL